MGIGAREEKRKSRLGELGYKMMIRTTREQIFWGDSVLVISIEKINEKINEEN